MISGPGINYQGTMTDDFVLVTDLTPSILELLDINNHDGNWDGKEVKPIVGSGFSRFLAGNSVQIHYASESIGYELGGNSALFGGDYKIVISPAGQNETEWQLFNIKSNPGETKDLATDQVDLLAEMLSDTSILSAQQSGIRSDPLRILNTNLLMLQVHRHILI